MKKAETSEYRRLLAVFIKMMNHKEIWEGNPVVEAAVNKLKAILESMELAHKKQMHGSKPTTAAKNGKELDLVDTVKVVTSFLNTIADEKDLGGLKKLASISRSAMLNMSGIDLVAFGNVIVEEVERFSSDLDSLNFTLARREAFAQQVLGYRVWVNAPRSVIADRSAGTRSLPGLCKQGRDLIKNRLDGIMLMYKEEHPIFYAEYKAVRKRVKPGVRHQHETHLDLPDPGPIAIGFDKIDGITEEKAKPQEQKQQAETTETPAKPFIPKQNPIEIWNKNLAQLWHEYDSYVP